VSGYESCAITILAELISGAACCDDNTPELIATGNAARLQPFPEAKAGSDLRLDYSEASGQLNGVQPTGFSEAHVDV